jgi:hypothetical protein
VRGYNYQNCIKCNPDAKGKTNLCMEHLLELERKNSFKRITKRLNGVSDEKSNNNSN